VHIGTDGDGNPVLKFPTRKANFLHKLLPQEKQGQLEDLTKLASSITPALIPREKANRPTIGGTQGAIDILRAFNHILSNVELFSEEASPVQSASTEPAPTEPATTEPKTQPLATAEVAAPRHNANANGAVLLGTFGQHNIPHGGPNGYLSCSSFALTALNHLVGGGAIGSGQDLEDLVVLGARHHVGAGLEGTDAHVWQAFEAHYYPNISLHGPYATYTGRDLQNLFNGLEARDGNAGTTLTYGGHSRAVFYDSGTGRYTLLDSLARGGLSEMRTFANQAAVLAHLNIGRDVEINAGIFVRR
jgi:hypothetical protein